MPAVVKDNSSLLGKHAIVDCRLSFSALQIDDKEHALMKMTLKGFPPLLFNGQEVEDMLTYIDTFQQVVLLMREHNLSVVDAVGIVRQAKDKEMKHDN